MPMSSSNSTVEIDRQGRSRNADTVTKKGGLDRTDFSEALKAVDQPATYLVAREVDGVADPTIQHQAAAATHATLNGVAGATNGYGYGAPYLGAPVSPQGGGFGSVGGFGGGLVAANNHGGVGVGNPGTDIGAPGGTEAGIVGGGGFSQDYYEKRAVLQAMNDSNWQMLLLQNDVQNVNREFTILSNIMSVRHQTDMNMLRNTGRAAG